MQPPFLLRALFLPAALTLFAAPAALAQAEWRPGFDSYVRDAMRQWQVPGLAIAIVRDTGVALLRGYGVRRAGAAEPVDEHTIFGIGSLTKAFTAAAVGMLVDERRIRWDDRVAERLPEFRLADPGVTYEVTVRDLLAHRTGLGRVEMAWYGSGASRAEVVRRLRFARAVSGPRERFNYQNVGYVVAGELLGAVAGASWDDVVRRRLLEPLGMRETSTSLRALDGAANVALPHVPFGDTLRAVAYRNVDNGGPAASMNSSAADLARWLRFQLDSGRVAGRPLLSPATFAELRRPQVMVPLSAAARRQNPHRHLRAYALGWYVEDYRGRELFWHRGHTDGMSAAIAVVPEERTGVVVLTNGQSSALPIALVYRVLDDALGAPPTDWSSVLLADLRSAAARGRAFEARADSARIPGTRPSLPLTAYAGTFVDSLYGEVRVTAIDGRLTISAGADWRGDLEHWHHDTFRVRWHELLREGAARATFPLDADGRVSRLILELEGPIEFTRAEGTRPR